MIWGAGEAAVLINGNQGAEKANVKAAHDHRVLLPDRTAPLKYLIAYTVEADGLI
jgi:hypothetical protein